MSRWCNMPKEILYNIFKYVSEEHHKAKQKSLAQCALTCRNWRRPAQEELFRTFYVITGNGICEAIRDYTEQQTNISLPLLVKKICFTSKFSDCCRQSLHWSSQEYLINSIDFFFPRLEGIQPFYHYDFIHVYQKILEGKFRSLKTVPVYDEGISNLYEKCVKVVQTRTTNKIPAYE